MNAFVFSKKLPDTPNQLEMIADILAQKKFEEKKIVRKEIKNQLDLAARKEHYDHAIILRDMLNYFTQYILD